MELWQRVAFLWLLHSYHSGLFNIFIDLFSSYSMLLGLAGSVSFKRSWVTKTSLGLISNKVVCFSVSEVHATGFNYQNEDEKVTLSFPSTLQKGKSYFHAFCLFQPRLRRLHVKKLEQDSSVFPEVSDCECSAPQGVCPLRVTLWASGVENVVLRMVIYASNTWGDANYLPAIGS